jgi:hypothetical protein
MDELIAVSASDTSVGLDQSQAAGAAVAVGDSRAGAAALLRVLVVNDDDIVKISR